MRKLLPVHVFILALGLGACGSGLHDSSQFKNSNADQIFVHVMGSSGGRILLQASVPKSHDKMWFCSGDGVCEAATGTQLNLVSANGERSIFQLSEEVSAAAGFTMKLVASSSSSLSSQPLSRTIRLVAASSNSTTMFAWQKEIEMVDVPSTGRACDARRYSRFYCEVMQYTRSPYLGSGDPATDVHETQHFMLHENTKPGSKFVYFQDGKGAHFPEPRILTRDVAEFIPFKSGMYYGTYIASRPTQVLGENIVDEWRAYLTEEIFGIERGSSEGMGAGGVEFLYYNAAMMHALAQQEPAYLSNKQGVAVFAMLAEIAHEWSITKGVEKGFFNSAANQRARKILDLMRNDQAHAPMRESLKKIYGAAWTARVLGIN
jgi:hypothetical protein